MIRKILICTFFLLLSATIFYSNNNSIVPSYNGIVTNGSYSVHELVRDIFIEGRCDNVANIRSFGDDKGIGYFENGSDVIGLERGIILSTGSISNAHGPNDVGNKSEELGNHSSDPDLKSLTQGIIQDRVGIEFEFIPLDSVVTFRYVFASEEYCQYVDTRFNDVFGFFIKGPGIRGEFSGNAKNVALIPNTEDYVSINNVNHLKNSEYYISNILEQEAEECDLSYEPSPYTELIEYDGFTKILVATIKLIPCESYTIRFALSDVQDQNFDSAIFLEAGSFNIGGEVGVVAVQGNNRDSVIYEGCQDGYFLFERLDRRDTSTPLSVRYTLSPRSTATSDLDFQALTGEITIPVGQTEQKLPIWALNDSIVETNEEIVLELDIPCACYNDTAIIVLSEPPPMSLELEDIRVCTDERLNLYPNLTGGVGDYTYQWNTGSTDDHLTLFPTDTTQYTVMVTDACDHLYVDSNTIYVSPPPEAYIDGYKELCEGDTTIFTIDFTGEAPWRFSYSIDGVTQRTYSEISNNPFYIPAIEGGTYELVHFEDKDCVGERYGEALVVPVILRNTVQALGLSCFGADNGSIRVTPSGGEEPYIYRWEGLEDETTGFVDDLPAGTYVMEVEDAHNCIEQEEIIISTPEPVGALEYDCNDIRGDFTQISAVGGTPPYRYSVNGSFYEDSNLFDKLDPGRIYNLRIRDANDCLFNQNFMMPYVRSSLIELEEEKTVKVGSTYRINPDLSIPESFIDSISWTPITDLNCLDCLSPIFTAREEQEYTLLLIDRWGCQDKANIAFKLSRDVDAFFPSAFSPNYDHDNDRFTVFADRNQVVEVASLQVFDRWGNLVFTNTNFPPNEVRFGWDGTMRGKAAKKDVYVFYAQLQLADGTIVEKSGDVLLMR